MIYNIYQNILMLHLKETLQSNISKIFLSKSEPSALQSSKSSSIMSSTVEFVHDSPQQLLHALMHLIPFFLHEHAAVPHGFFEDMLQHLNNDCEVSNGSCKSSQSRILHKSSLSRFIQLWPNSTCCKPVSTDIALCTLAHLCILLVHNTLVDSDTPLPLVNPPRFFKLLIKTCSIM